VGPDARGWRQAGADRLDLVRETAAEPFVTVDGNGRITAWNAAAARVFGRDATEVTGQALVDFLVPEGQRTDAARAFAELLAAGAEASARRLEIVARDAAGAPLAVELASWPVRGPDGRWEYHVPVHDISERQRAAEERERLMTSQRLLLESSTEGIYGIDTDGRCTFVNPAAAAMLGWRVDELLGRDMHATIHHSHPDGSPYPADGCAALRALHTGRDVRVADDVFWRRDGRPLPVEFSCAAIL
jgi:PAS domain S-box-containing protein